MFKDEALKMEADHACAEHGVTACNECHFGISFNPIVEVELRVFVQVDSDGELGEDESRSAAREAIEEALHHANNRGYNHEFADVASVSVTSVEIEPKKTECSICLDAVENTITVMDLNESVPAEVCIRCYENECYAPGWGWSNDYDDPDKYEFIIQDGDDEPSWTLKSS